MGRTAEALADITQALALQQRLALARNLHRIELLDTARAGEHSELGPPLADLDQCTSAPKATDFIHRSPVASPMSDIEASVLFDRIGGVPGVMRMIDRFYESVLADPALRPFFEDVEMYKLRRMQYEFFSAALGGPTAYSGRTVQHAYHGRR